MEREESSHFWLNKPADPLVLRPWSPPISSKERNTVETDYRKLLGTTILGHGFATTPSTRTAIRVQNFPQPAFEDMAIGTPRPRRVPPLTGVSSGSLPVIRTASTPPPNGRAATAPNPVRKASGKTRVARSATSATIKKSSVNESYKCKYDFRMVSILKEFFDDLVNGQLRPGKSYGFLDGNIIKCITNALGRGRLSFKKVLSIMYPYASARDVVGMCAFAYPYVPSRIVEPVEMNLTSRQREELIGIFSMFDTDHSGDISLREFAEAVQQMNIDGSDVKRIYGSIDKDDSGSISIDEFIAFVAPIYFGSVN